jgi:hypothetical protein
MFSLAKVFKKAKLSYSTYVNGTVGEASWDLVNIYGGRKTEGIVAKFCNFLASLLHIYCKTLFDLRDPDELHFPL